ncbi:MAG: L,D-transpeptidase [Bacteroidota bacterium]
MHWYFLLGTSLLLTCQAAPTQSASAEPELSFPEQLAQQGIPLDSLWLLVDKSDYWLEVWYQDSALKRYSVVFGGDPVADKRMEGDQRTPEGTFSIRDAYPHAKWQYFLWIDYPTEASWEKHRAAKAAGEIPPDARVGGEIGIHGVPEGYDSAIRYRQTWTLGCVSLTSGDITELYQLVGKGTKVVIIP